MTRQEQGYRKESSKVANYAKYVALIWLIWTNERQHFIECHHDRITEWIL